MARCGIGQIGFAALQKMAQMCCDAEVVGCDLGRVPGRFECVGKSVDVRPTQARTQADQDLGRAEVLFQHDVLLVVLAMYGRTTVAGERPILWGARNPRNLVKRPPNQASAEHAHRALPIRNHFP